MEVNRCQGVNFGCVVDDAALQASKGTKKAVVGLIKELDKGESIKWTLEGSDKAVKVAAIYENNGTIIPIPAFQLKGSTEHMLDQLRGNVKNVVKAYKN